MKESKHFSNIYYNIYVYILLDANLFIQFQSDLWRQENALQQNYNMLTEEKSKKDQLLRSMVGKTVLNGRDSVNKVLEIFNERGGQFQQISQSYYGMLIENFDCSKEFYTAIEMTSGNKLFHHIVENDKVGTRILQEMNKMKLAGEVTFMPINRLYSKDIDYPQTGVYLLYLFF